MKKILPVLLFIILTEATGLIGSIATFPSIPTWYLTLNKPSFNPPNWLFGPVWTTLFAMMGIAAFLVWQKGMHKKPVKEAIIVFSIQLVLNIFWSIIFFGLHQPGVAFIEIVILWLMILITILRFYKISRPAGLLLIPYLLWVSFASFLNLVIVILN